MFAFVCQCRVVVETAIQELAALMDTPVLVLPDSEAATVRHVST